VTVKLVIFDCDGVIVDSEPMTDRILSDDLTAHGLPISAEEIHHLFTGGTMEWVEAESRRRGATLPDDWLDHIYGRIFAALDEGVPVVEGFLPLLDRIEMAGIATAIASNGPIAKMKRSLGPSGIFDRLDGRILSGHDHKPKPDPAMLHHAMAKAGVTAEETVMIDDMPAGTKAAQAAGVRCFGLCIHGSPDRFKGTDATVVPDLMAVQDALGL
jgi:HAD superfamily hydrolase (TIGR01509 family)